jgi:phosphate/sulfate permease
MWIGFMFAGYSAIANDSIQTIGTFIASNHDRKWWQLWLYIGLIFVATVLYSWIVYDGDVSFQRLTSKGFDESPSSFHFLQLAAPLILLFLTRMRMPVSTTFMLLSAFSASSEGIIGVTIKSLSGYFIAFATAIVAWYLAGALVKRLTSGKPHPAWRVGQWIISGWLWSMWITHDAANIAIFLNRQLTLYDFLFFAGFIFFGLGLLFYLRGDKIQQIVTEKSQVTDVRSASIIDLVYAFILLFFKEMSTIPMSTTWVFLGLLGGREVAMHFSKSLDNEKTTKATFKMVGKDISYATFGLLVSIALAAAINPVIQEDIKGVFGF